MLWEVWWTRSNTLLSSSSWQWNEDHFVAIFVVSLSQLIPCRWRSLVSQHIEHSHTASGSSGLRLPDNKILASGSCACGPGLQRRDTPAFSSLTTDVGEVQHDSCWHMHLVPIKWLRRPFYIHYDNRWWLNAELFKLFQVIVLFDERFIRSREIQHCTNTTNTTICKSCRYKGHHMTHLDCSCLACTGLIQARLLMSYLHRTHLVHLLLTLEAGHIICCRSQMLRVRYLQQCKLRKRIQKKNLQYITSLQRKKRNQLAPGIRHPDPKK